MKGTPEISLSLLDNSHAFLCEAVDYAITADNDPRKWQFAVLNLAQSLELSLKSLLHQVHPILVYKDVDNPKHTVMPSVALKRLCSPHVEATQVSEKERKFIDRLFKVRNELMHSSFTLKPEYARKKFSESFGFVAGFQERHFDQRLSGILGSARFGPIMETLVLIKEVAKKAGDRIDELGVPEDQVRECPNCEYVTFVLDGTSGKCFSCDSQIDLEQCNQCSDYYYPHDIIDFSDEFDTDLCEGRVEVMNSYGYTFHTACVDCVSAIREDIANQRNDEEHYHNMLLEGYMLENRHGKV